MEKQPQISAGEILCQLRAIAMADVTGMLSVRDGQLEIRSTDQLSSDARAAISSVEKSAGGLKVKFYDKLKALELLGKYLGQWCAAEGLVYAFDENRHICAASPEHGRWYISVDYGTHNPFSAGLWCVAEGKAVRVREFYHSGRDSGRLLTDQEYYEQLEKLAADAPVEQVIVDPSAASFIALIRRHGRFRVRRARNAVLPGIRRVAELLRQERLLFSPACRNSIREFGLYSWEDDPAKDAPRKENDHAMDDIRYFVMTVMGRE